MIWYTSLFFLAAPLSVIALPSTAPKELVFRDTSIASTCSSGGGISCRNTTTVSNLCCFEAPGGLLMQTQFWDYSPATGPSNSWTIHGLWPDNCDGTYASACDSSRAYTGINTILTNNGGSDTLSYMNTYWVDINNNNEQFWEHEWAKHGTCMSTFTPSCLPSGSPYGADAAAFFKTTVGLFKTLPTYTWLANAGITPSSTKTWTLAQLVAALTIGYGGYTPALTCTGSNLNAVAYYFNLQGSAIDGKFIPINAATSSSCPSTGIYYLPKTGSATGTTASTPTSTSSPSSLPTKGTITAVTSSGSVVGGLLTAATWSTQTLATFSFTGTLSSFTMTSSKGNCGVSSGALTCGSGVSLTSFSAVSSGGSLLVSAGGSTAFSSDGTPSGTTVYTAYTGSSHSKTYTLKIVSS